MFDHLRLDPKSVQWNSLRAIHRRQEIDLEYLRSHVKTDDSPVPDKAHEIQPVTVAVVTGVRVPPTTRKNFTPDEAVTKIASLFRMHKTLKWYSQWRLSELVFLKRLLPVHVPPISSDEQTRRLQIRLEEIELLEKNFHKKSEMHALEKSAVIDYSLNLDFVEKLKINFWDHFQATGEFLVNAGFDTGEAPESVPVTTPPESKKKPTPKAAAVQPSLPPADTVTTLSNILTHFCLPTAEVDKFDSEQYMKEKKVILYKEILEREFARIRNAHAPVIPEVKARSASPKKKDKSSKEMKEVIVDQISVTVEDVFFLLRRPSFRPMHAFLGDPNDLKMEILSSNPSTRSGILYMLIEELVVPRILSLPGHRSVLLYGPSQGGKKTLVNTLASECDAAVVRLDPGLISEHSKGLVGSYIIRLVNKAEKFHPVFVLVEHVDSLFSAWKATKSKTGKGKATQTYSKEAFIKDVLEGLLAKVHDTELIVFATTSNPNAEAEVISQLFEKRVFLPLPNKGDREAVILDTLANSGILSERFGNRERDLLNTLVGRTEGSTFHEIRAAIEGGLKMDPAMIGDNFVKFSSAPQTKSSESWEHWHKWTTENTPEIPELDGKKSNSKGTAKSKK